MAYPCRQTITRLERFKRGSRGSRSMTNVTVIRRKQLGFKDRRLDVPVVGQQTFEVPEAHWRQVLQHQKHYCRAPDWLLKAREVRDEYVASRTVQDRGDTVDSC